jgi:hypothetical protein
MRRDDQTIELVVGVVGEREHHPVLTGFAATHLDAANDAVGAGCGGDLDAVGVAMLIFEDAGEIDRRRVTADADSVNSLCRCCGNNSHQAERERREPPDQTQCHSPRSTKHRPCVTQKQGHFPTRDK